MGPPSGISNYQWLRFNFFFIAEHFLGLEAFNKVLGEKRKAFYAEIDEQLKDSGRGELLPMPVVDKDISREEFYEKYFKGNLPLVLKGAAKDWQSGKKWSFDFFKEHYGQKEVVIVDNEGMVDRNNPQKFETMTLGEYLDAIAKGSKKYLKFSRVMDDESELRNDFDLTWIRSFRPKLSVGDNFLAFIGNDKAMTPIHSGLGHTLFLQVTGKKKWHFWKANERIFFDPRAARKNYNYSKADPYDLNDPDFPLLKYAQHYEVTLEPGDVLWFPSHIWHQVESREAGISVAYKFSHLPGSFRASKLLTTLFFFQTNPTLFTDLFFYLFMRRDVMYTTKTSQ
jgi:hypothetical protein